jgi:alpha-methylacyl-CoA racemase
MRAHGSWSDTRGANLLDGGAPFYATYACADQKFISVGALEPHFYALLLKLAGVDDPAFSAQMDQAGWPQLRDKFAQLFRTRTRDQWCLLLEGTDACFAPVLDMGEAPLHPHNVARATFVEVDGVVQPAPAPRFSRTEPVPGAAAGTASSDADGAAILRHWGWSDEALERLRTQGVIDDATHNRTT